MTTRIPGPARTCDAVVFLPGTMGSALRSKETGKIVWGLEPKAMINLLRGGGLRELVVTDEELAGQPRLEPAGLLRMPALLPFLGGLEPYNNITAAIPEVLTAPDALTGFAYDWRLSIAESAGKLVRHCEQVHQAWTRRARADFNIDPDDVKVQLVAHSMGGLVARYAVEELGLDAIVRRVVTLGTPYYGAVKAVRLLTLGKGAPIPVSAALVRDLARSAPGIHDLLPRYRCVEDASTTRHLTTGDIAALDGNPQLAQEAANRWTRLNLSTSTSEDGGHASGSESAKVAYECLVGIEQPTLQGMTLANGDAQFYEHVNGTILYGDATVYRHSSYPSGNSAATLPQSHGAIAKSPESRAFVRDQLIGGNVGAPMGTSPVGLRVPDVVTAGQVPTVEFTVEAGAAVTTVITSTDLSTGTTYPWRDITATADQYIATGPVLPPGMHRIEAKSGGYAAVSEIVLIDAR